jgi:NAD(P)-dependent dehydrogenase (short-subunit alcohol dehydrogenase family)
MTVDLTGRVALVTGGNRGIGFEVCRSLGHAGAKVILGSRDETKGEASAAQLRSEGLDVVCRQFDVQSNASVEALAAWLEGEHGKLDVLVNNAGILPTSKGLLETTLDEVDAMWQVNTMGPGVSRWRCCL